ncbi:adenylate/guanylate cyclase domain-containing protein [Mesorhizobium sp. LjNodule214]|uniref:adenylate/guanylate cyclase domain-containing protein n=1 Tax=Mesorhizobium sp. LjNodule214 TaxID=3342252 RepID=UPI003ED16950
MADERVRRRLAAIAVADVVGYSRLMEVDEVGTLAALKHRRSDILQPLIRGHGGRIVKLMGDGVLMEFSSAVHAVEAALELQTRMSQANNTVAQERHIVLRIGINLGDVIGEGSDLYGEGVNVAARLEALAEPGGICISAKVYEETRDKVDAPFEDLGEVELKNMARPVRAYRVGTKVERMGVYVTDSSAATKPSIVVLPFDNMSGDAGQQYLSDGITEDIITELSRFKNLTVAARHVSFQLASKAANSVQAARNIGANYVVEGSVRRAGDRIRITAQLIDAKSGNHIWAERYDTESLDIFVVQDEVVAAVASTLEGRMVAAAAVQVRKRPTSSWTAYDFFLQGRELCDANHEREAIPLFSRAVAIDPSFVQAHAWLAIAHLGQYWFDANPGTLRDASIAGQRALELDSSDPTVHHANGIIALWSRQYERAGMHFDRAIALNPVDAQIRADRAHWLRFSGRQAEALVAIDEALGRSVFSPLWFWLIRGGILFDLRRYDEAVEALDHLPKKHHLVWLMLASAHAHLEHASLMEHALAAALEIKPDVSLHELIMLLPHADPGAIEPLLDGLRKAGLPEHARS